MPAFPLFIPSVHRTAREYLDLVSTEDSTGKRTATASNDRREEILLEFLLEGSVPGHMQGLVEVSSQFKSKNGGTHDLVLYVQPDGVCVGTDDDYLRVPMTPVGGQKYADAVDGMLPTKKIVDLVWASAINKIPPMPWGEPYDNTMNDTHRHVVQNKKINDYLKSAGRDPTLLSAGHKKDVVISNKLSRSGFCAIYGWTQLNGAPIQPLYNGHDKHYTDYSEHVRLVSKECLLDGAPYSLESLLQDPVYCDGASDEGPVKFLRQP